MGNKKMKIQGMIPVKKWLLNSEAAAYLSISPETFKKIARENNLSVSAFSRNLIYYKVSELDAMMENNIIIHQV